MTRKRTKFILNGSATQLDYGPCQTTREKIDKTGSAGVLSGCDLTSLPWRAHTHIRSVYFFLGFWGELAHYKMTVRDS